MKRAKPNQIAGAYFFQAQSPTGATERILTLINVYQHPPVTSPYYTQARFAYKRSAKWVGYKVHLTETCDEETPNIITNVQTECATFNHNYSLPKIHEQLSQPDHQGLMIEPRAV